MPIDKDILFHLCCEVVDDCTHGLGHSRSGIIFRVTKRRYGVRIFIRVRNKVNRTFFLFTKIRIKDKSDVELFKRIAEGLHTALDNFY